MSDEHMPTVDDLLRRMRQQVVMQKAVNPSAPDPDEYMRPIEDLVRKYPPTIGPDGRIDFSPTIEAAAQDSGQDRDVLARAFNSGVEEDRRRSETVD